MSEYTVEKIMDLEGYLNKKFPGSIKKMECPTESAIRLLDKFLEEKDAPKKDPVTPKASDKIILVEFADGCRDHFCLGRYFDNGKYIEYYNKGEWCAFGELFIGREVATKMLKKLNYAYANKTKYGFEKCEFSDDTCEKCNKKVKDVFFRSNNPYDCREGDYWCMDCVLKEEAANEEYEANMKTLEICLNCEGSGYDNNDVDTNNRIPCTVCRGTGKDI